MTASVVVARDSDTFQSVRDSKKMKEDLRENVVDSIHSTAVFHCTRMVSSEDVDRFGISVAWFRLIRTLIQEAYKKYPNIKGTIDGSISIPGYSIKAIPKADDTVPVVSAASVLAKYLQTCFMDDADVLYPKYGFNQHHGYGTAAHMKALEVYGPCPIHRTSFRPIKNMLSRTAGRSLA